MPSDLTPDEWAALPGLVEAAEAIPRTYASADAHDTLYTLATDLARAALAERARAEAAEAERERLREAVQDAVVWHEAQDKALSEQPPSWDRGWRRNEDIFA